MTPEPRRWRAEASLAFIAALWGSNFVLIKAALDDVSTITWLAVRFAIGSLALAGALYWTGKLRQWPSRRQTLAALFTGALLYAGYVLQTTGLRYTTPGKAGFLTGLYIPLVPLFSALVYRIAPRPLEAAGVLAAFAGMGLLTVTGEGEWWRIGYGDGLMIACAAVYAWHLLVLDRYARMVPVAWLTLLQILACAGFALSTFSWVETPKFAWSSTVAVALAYSSLLATALAFTMWTWAQKQTTATRAALIFSLEPVFALLVSAFATGERLSPRGGAGAVLILAGILLAELKPRSIPEHPSV